VYWSAFHYSSQILSYSIYKEEIFYLAQGFRDFSPIALGVWCGEAAHHGREYVIRMLLSWPGSKKS
jgi:hypothetical protein